MEEEQSAKVIKSASKLQYPVPNTRDSKLKTEIEWAFKQAKDHNEESMKIAKESHTRESALEFKITQ